MLTRRSENATVTLCHTGTRDLAGDRAAGRHRRRRRRVRPGSITADMVKPGAAVLDAGVSRVDGKIAGDVAADVAEVAGWLSPNPGGVGPDDPRDAAAQRRRGGRARLTVRPS